MKINLSFNLASENDNLQYKIINQSQDMFHAMKAFETWLAESATSVSDISDRWSDILKIYSIDLNI